MLTGTLLTIALAQAPLFAVAAPDPVPVEGRVELSPSAADASARERAVDEVRRELARRGASAVAASRPIWMPHLVAEKVVADWMRRLPAERAVEVVDAVRESHDHGGYLSYRTTLHVTTDRTAMQRMLNDLRRRIDDGGERFAWLLGGTAGLWAVLALAYGWVDRLTRGYMPWRLRVVCVGMGLAGPGIALLFV